MIQHRPRLRDIALLAAIILPPSAHAGSGPKVANMVQVDQKVCDQRAGDCWRVTTDLACGDLATEPHRGDSFFVRIKEEV